MKLSSLNCLALAAMVLTAGMPQAQSAEFNVVNSYFSADASASAYTGDVWAYGGGPMPYPIYDEMYNSGVSGASANATAWGQGQIMQMMMMPDPNWIPDPMNPGMPPPMIPMPMPMGMYNSQANANATAGLTTGGSQLTMGMGTMVNTMPGVGGGWGFYGDVHAEAHASGSVDFNFGSAHALVTMDVQATAPAQMGYFNIVDLSGGAVQMGGPVGQMGQVVLNASHTYRLTGDVRAMSGGSGMGGGFNVTLSVSDLAPVGGGGGLGMPTDPFMPWQYAPPPAGQPLLPPEWLFPGRTIGDIGPGRNSFMFFDPDYATGYFIEVAAGNPKIAQIVLPNCGDGLYNLYSVDADGNKTLLQADLAAGESYSLATAADKLFVDGIEESAQLDITDPLAFQVGLIFDGPGTAEVTMTPVPEPSTLVLLAIGAASLLAYALQQQKHWA